jgi:hypothetical protein
MLRDCYRKWDLADFVTNEDHCTLVVELSDAAERIWMGVNRNGQALGGGLPASFKGTVYNTLGGVLPESYNLHPNCLLHWDTFGYGRINGYRFPSH